MWDFLEANYTLHFKHVFTAYVLDFSILSRSLASEPDWNHFIVGFTLCHYHSGDLGCSSSASLAIALEGKVSDKS